MGVNVDRDYFSFTVAAMVLLAAIIILPGLASTLDTSRFYHLLLFFLAPMCVLGAEFLLKLVHSQEKILSFHFASCSLGTIFSISNRRCVRSNRKLQLLRTTQWVQNSPDTIVWSIWIHRHIQRVRRSMDVNKSRPRKQNSICRSPLYLFCFKKLRYARSNWNGRIVQCYNSGFK